MSSRFAMIGDMFWRSGQIGSVDSHNAMVKVQKCLPETAVSKPQPCRWRRRTECPGAFAIGMLALAVGFVVRMSRATTLWPWPDGRLSYIFIGSMYAAVGAGFAMFLLIDEPAAGQATIRWSFLAFVVILIFASTGLIIKAETLFPWLLNPDSSVLFR